MAAKIAEQESQETESNAFRKSSLITIVGAFSRVAWTDNICCNHDVFSNVPTDDEACLVPMDEKRNDGLEPIAKNFCNGLIGQFWSELVDNRQEVQQG